MLKIYLLGFLLTYHQTETNSRCENLISDTKIEVGANWLSKKTVNNSNSDLTTWCGTVEVTVTDSYVKAAALFCMNKIMEAIAQEQDDLNSDAQPCNVSVILKVFPPVGTQCVNIRKVESCIALSTPGALKYGEETHRNKVLDNDCTICSFSETVNIGMCMDEAKICQTIGNLIQQKEFILQKYCLGCPPIKSATTTKTGNVKTKYSMDRLPQKGAVAAGRKPSYFLTAVALLQFCIQISEGKFVNG